VNQRRHGDEPSMVDEMAREGFVPRRWFAVLEEYQPHTLQLYMENSKRLLETRVEIDRKTAEFIQVAIDAVVDWKNIDSHIDKAFEAGATIQELIDVCAIAAKLMGPHAFNSGVTGIDRVIEARRAQGKPVPRDRSERHETSSPEPG
jgi:alkylhydroperoxidase/carboxymuconolactone decarboxylase family protein YurZ